MYQRRPVSLILPSPRRWMIRTLAVTCQAHSHLSQMSPVFLRHFMYDLLNRSSVARIAAVAHSCICALMCRRLHVTALCCARGGRVRRRSHMRARYSTVSDVVLQLVAFTRYGMCVLYHCTIDCVQMSSHYTTMYAPARSTATRRCMCRLS